MFLRALSVIFGVQFVQSASLIDCSNHANVLNIDYLLLQPPVPVIGDILTITIGGVPTERIEDGKIHFTLLGPPLFDPMHMSSALCDYALCPIGADNWFYTTAKVQLPITMPQGNYTLKVEIDDPEGVRELGCFIISSDVKNPKPKPKLRAKMH